MAHDPFWYDTAVAALRGRGPHAGSRWRHLKTGGRYEVVCNGLVEASLTPCVVYRSLDRPAEPYWVRPLDEFLDGRFAPEGT